MRILIKNISAFLLCILLFGACEKPVSFDYAEFESRITVTALFDSNSPWSVNVSRSHNILDPNTDVTPVGSASVIIYDQNGNFLHELEHIGEGVYEKGKSKPSTARGYYVEVIVGDDIVKAYSYVPEKTKLIINDFHIERVDETQVIKGVEVDFRIEDKSSFESYFIWDIITIDADAEEESTEPAANMLSSNFLKNLEKDPDDIKFDDDIVAGGLFGDGTFSTTYSSLEGNRSAGPKFSNSNSDTNSSGKSVNGFVKSDPNSPIFINVSDVLGVGPTGGGGNEGSDPKGEMAQLHYELRVMSISKELYDYYHSYESYHGSEKKSKPLYSNINGGLGIFAGYNETFKRF